MVCYAASSGNFLLTFRENPSVPSSGIKNTKGFGFGFSTPEDGTDRLSRNVVKKLRTKILLDSRPMKLGPISFPKTSVRN
jgi:hypothetical protein